MYNIIFFLLRASLLLSSGWLCATCQYLREKCTSECLFAAHFPRDQPLKFANLHKIFGTSNVSKMLYNPQISRPRWFFSTTKIQKSNDHTRSRKH
ncbi:hypothetical protein MPTK1_3g04655 [Marchantia polymorpha subsp. ruderalis]